MKNTISTSIFILALLVSLIIGFQSVQATETDFPIVTGICQLSSSNDPSGFKILALKVTTWTMAANDIYHSVSYSIDGENTVLMPFEIIPYTKSLILYSGTIVGEATLPILPNGSHNMTVYVQTTSSAPLPFEDLLSLNETLYFNLEGQPAITPSPISTPTFTPNPSPTPSPTSLTSPSPSQNPSLISSPSPIITPFPSSTQQPTTPTITPSLSLTPLSSPTQQPTLSPNPSAANYYDGVDILPLILGVVAFVIIAITVVGLAVYFTKFRKKKTAA
jgi:hypothetical protein